MENSRCPCAVKLRKLSFNGGWIFTGYWGNEVMRRGKIRGGILGRGWSGKEVAVSPRGGRVAATVWQRPDGLPFLRKEWSRAGRRADPLATGVMSMSFGSTRDFRVHFCKMMGRNKNSSVQARPSPTQICFPENKDTPWTLCFWTVTERIQSSYLILLNSCTDGRQDVWKPGWLEGLMDRWMDTLAIHLITSTIHSKNIYWISALCRLLH